MASFAGESAEKVDFSSYSQLMGEVQKSRFFLSTNTVTTSTVPI